MKTKQFAVIGIGRFGESLIYELRRMNHDVLAIDTNEDRIEDNVNIATHIVQADSTDEKILRALDIQSFHTVIVAIGGDLQASILTVITLQELGVQRIIAKAQNAMHGKVLEKMGIKTVIYPERDMAIRLARSLISSNIIEQIELSSEFGITEFRATKYFAERSLAQLQLPNKFKVTILAVKSGDNITVNPSAKHTIHEGDILVVFGSNDFIENLSELNDE
ncbi:MAG: TrkA family potassium uptake protein [Syntrophomonadaceae bacterium]|nr:TrkA family potassium uptake protein [Syntrophomonadaceae bacterium]MDD3022573.1 TrkA family potassium uptake protein [Syntrophomonadaceae bacterium]